MSLISRRKGAHRYVVLVKLSKSISTLWPSNPRPKTNCTVRAKPAERWDNVLQGHRLRMCSALSDSLQPVDGSPPGPSVPGILQAGIPEQVAISCSRDLPNPGTELPTGSWQSSPLWRLSSCRLTLLSLVLSIQGYMFLQKLAFKFWFVFLLSSILPCHAVFMYVFNYSFTFGDC